MKILEDVMTDLYGWKKANIEGFSRIVGEDVVGLVQSKAPKKVITRIFKAAEHYSKAKRLAGFDDEMAVIRLVAAEEELVVAFFELIKTQLRKGGNYRAFVNKYKSHQVKLSFYPVLSQVKFILKRFLSESSSDLLETDSIDFRGHLIIEGERVVARIHLGESGKYIDHNPMALVISLEEESYDGVLESLFETFRSEVAQQTGLSVKDFVEKRSDFRNKILYADDAGVYSMGEDIDFLINDVFSVAIHDMMWLLCIVLSNPVNEKSDFLLKQFFDLYARILREAKIKGM